MYICLGRECKETELKSGFRGQKSVTRSGLTCRSWSSQSPHQHNIIPQNENLEGK